MSLRPQQPIPPVPDDTARIARAAFRRGNPYLLLRDRLGAVFDDAGFAELYPKLGQPAYAPWRLALVTLMQFREGLSDRQAAEAVRGRIDWKHLLAWFRIGSFRVTQARGKRRPVKTGQRLDRRPMGRRPASPDQARRG